MATDEELLLINTLQDNWNTSNAPLPKFYYDDTIKLHDFRNFDAIKVYVMTIPEEPKGIGYIAYKKEVFATIDVRSENRTRILQDRDEIKRIILLFRKTLTGYDIFKKINERKVNAYINYYQYIIDVSLMKYRTAI